MNDIDFRDERDYGFGFVPREQLEDGQDEYWARDARLGRDKDRYRRLKAGELETLVKAGNSCTDWDRILVADPFTPELIRGSEFAGLVRIGRLVRVCLEHHELVAQAGITDSRIISCDIGDDCAIHDCSYIAHYQIGEGCILINNDEIHCTNHAKFGNGILKRGEPEDSRVWIDPMNEAGGRSILPFDGMTCADAYLWARYRDDEALMEAFKRMTQERYDDRRGYYGSIGSSCVIKSCHVIKDARIGDCAYVKGANKLKNITVNSSDAERTQIGEGVELVNGIVGYGCRVFYGCKAVRFLMGTNSALKYGARLIHSVLGDNSTVSCCELLNNLIFPAHEQHHNTSFLIAALVKGQSNMAAGATIGSNHNSRSNDGEIEAGRGFWPGLCTSLKHSSRFASYVLLAKGSYRFELDIPYPFSLVSDDESRDRLSIAPAWWWRHNMYALMRNESKFISRDKRITRDQAIEFSPFAPDTMEECLSAMRLLEVETGRAFASSRGDPHPDQEAAAALGRSLFLGEASAFPDIEVFASGVECSSRKVELRSPRAAWKAYRHMVAFYGAKELLAWFEAMPGATAQDAAEILSFPREAEWENLGGQLVPGGAVRSLLSDVKSGAIRDWEGVHAAYRAAWEEYPSRKALHAYGCLREMEGKPSLGRHDLLRILERFRETTLFIEESVLATRRKDFDNPFRKATFRSEAEQRAVLGTAESAPFARQCRGDMAGLREAALRLTERLAADRGA